MDVEVWKILITVCKSKASVHVRKQGECEYREQTVKHGGRGIMFGYNQMGVKNNACAMQYLVFLQNIINVIHAKWLPRDYQTFESVRVNVILS